MRNAPMAVRVAPTDSHDSHATPTQFPSENIGILTHSQTPAPNSHSLDGYRGGSNGSNRRVVAIAALDVPIVKTAADRGNARPALVQLLADALVSDWRARSAAMVGTRSGDDHAA